MKRFSMAMTWLALAGLMTTVSCRKPVVGFTNGEARTVTISAVTENGDGSKTSIDGRNVNWSEGDKISMNGSVLTLKEGAGTTKGVFEGTVTSEAPYYVGYPADATTYSVTTLKLSIPAEWTYNTEKQIVPMAAVTNSVEGGLQFHNAVNMLKLQLKGDGDAASELKSIVLTSTTSNLSGKINVTFTGETPAFAAIAAGDGASKTMTVLFGDGLQLTDAAKCVYIPLAKISVDDVLTVRFNCANGKYMERKVTADANFNAVNNMLSDELTVNATDKEYEYVDLGLPSGLLWATCNVGADNPEDYGWYFMWGSVTKGGDLDCSWEKCPSNGGYSYNNETVFSTWRATHLINNVLNPEVDAATANWGGGWRMPTKEEWEELCKNTNYELTTENGEYGCKFTNKTDNSKYIFLPAAGRRSGTSLKVVGSQGYYWSSSLVPNSTYGTNYMGFSPSFFDPSFNNTRNNGYTVRPVR